MPGMHHNLATLPSEKMIHDSSVWLVLVRSGQKHSLCPGLTACPDCAGIVCGITTCSGGAGGGGCGHSCHESTSFLSCSLQCVTSSTSPCDTRGLPRPLPSSSETAELWLGGLSWGSVAVVKHSYKQLGEERVYFHSQL